MKRVSFSSTNDVKVFHSSKAPISINDTIKNRNFQPQHQPIVKLTEIHYVHSTLRGKVTVRNLDYHKQLSLKLTQDNWRSSIIINDFKYLKSNGEHDEFIFSSPIRLSGSIELVVSYRTQGQEFWDNNNGLNYCFTITTPVFVNDFELFDLFESLVFDSDSDIEEINDEKFLFDHIETIVEWQLPKLTDFYSPDIQIVSWAC